MNPIPKPPALLQAPLTLTLGPSAVAMMNKHRQAAFDYLHGPRGSDRPPAVLEQLKATYLETGADLALWLRECPESTGAV
jgi:hypothetical protein